MKRAFLLIILVGLCSISAAKTVRVSGTVTLYDGSTAVPGVIVVLDRSGSTLYPSCTTDVSGNYVMEADSGAYNQLRVRNLMKRISGIPYQMEYTAKTNLVFSDSLNTQDIAIKRFFNIHGTVLSALGDTIKGASIESGRDMGYGVPRDQDSSDAASGAYSLLTDSGNFRITVTPPAGSSVQQTYFDISASKDSLFNLILPVVITVSGIVKNYEGDTIKHIGVTFEKTGWQVDSATDSNGHYSIKLNPGTYSIRIRNGNMKTAQGAPAHLEQYIVKNAQFSKDTTLTITLPHYPIVRCSVVTVGGVPVANAIVKSSEGPMPGVPVGDLDTTGTGGVCVIRVRDSVKNNLWIIPPIGSEFAEKRDSLFTRRDTTLVITLKPSVILSGTVYFSDSLTPVSGAGVAIEYGSEQKMVSTNASGFYSIALIAGTYRLRVRNAGPGPGAPGVPQGLEYTVQDTVKLNASRTINVKLPLFPAISGIVKNAAGTGVANVTLNFSRWEGSEMPPRCQTTTDNSGAYSIVIGAGVNKVRVTPPVGSLLTTFEFIESFDSSKTKNIYIPDQARGITRVQPSVITRGMAGKILINGINANLLSVTSPSDLTLGAGILIDSIQTVSAITLYAYVRIDSNAVTGSRDIIVHAGATTSIGPNLLSITAPASAEIKLDVQGKTEKEVVISDGTGTELTIPAGTPVTLPPGADSVISYAAPIIKDETVKPTTGEFTSVQRTLEPSGLTFGDTVIMTCQYTKEDVSGIKEADLKPFYFIDSTSGKGSLGTEIAVVSRDTTANTISFVLPHFSMFRLAGPTTLVSNKTAPLILNYSKSDIDVPAIIGKQQLVRITISTTDATNTATVRVYSIQGRCVRTIVRGRLGQGTHSILWDGRSDDGTTLANGPYIIGLEVGKSQIRKKVVFVR